MSTRAQQAAALRFVEMAIDHKKIGKAQEAYRLTHKTDLLTAYHEAQRALEAKPDEGHDNMAQRQPEHDLEQAGAAPRARADER